MNTKRNSINIELEPKYCDIIKERCFGQQSLFEENSFEFEVFKDSQLPPPSEGACPSKSNKLVEDVRLVDNERETRAMEWRQPCSDKRKHIPIYSHRLLCACLSERRSAQKAVSSYNIGGQNIYNCRNSTPSLHKGTPCDTEVENGRD